VEWEHLMPQVIHDVRALVRKGLSSAQLLERSLGANANPEIRVWLDSMISSQRDLNVLMTRVGMLASASAGGRPGREELIDLDTALLGMRLRSRDALTESSAELQIVALPNCMVPVRLDTVWTELLENSIRFRDPDRPLRISIEAGNDETELWVQFEDNGAGWDAAFSSRLFQPFQRLSARKGGAGLGLAIARTIVESTGGQICAEPCSPGARFRVTIPVGALPQGTG